MTPRAPLSDEADREEREDRDRLRSLDVNLADLHHRRQGLLDEIYRLSDEQKSLYQKRQTAQARLEQLHEEHQALGKSLTEIRRAREAARRALDDVLGDARMVRTEVQKSELPRPDQIRREIAILEHKQQTTALPLSEENLLVDRLRELSKLLGRSHQVEGLREQQLAQRRAAEERVRSARAAFDRPADELVKAHHARDQKMREMRDGRSRSRRVRSRDPRKGKVPSRRDGTN